MSTTLVFVLICVLNFVNPILSIICDLKPRGAVGLPRDVGTRYRIVIANSPERYVPGQTYNVILQGRNSVVEEPNMFNGFMLTIETVERNDDSQFTGPLLPGTFKLIPNEKNTKIDEVCPNTVVHTSLTFVTSIEVQWIAPNQGTGCIRFRAVVMEQHIWYKDSGGLVLQLCEIEAFDTMDVPERCKSCNEAKYEMNFEGLWTRQNHPHSYPDNAWSTKFSDVIGASHGYDYRFWKINETASPGLVEFSERDNIKLLESEIKSNNTRTVIKAKGLSYPNITNKTFAVFRVDPEHHLLSIISFIRPSPDWFVGISGLALCDNNGKWTSHKNLDLYPYDLGLWSDLTYESRTRNTSDPITKIDESSDIESPFYSSTDEKLKPFARVHLVKSREYEKHCESLTEVSENGKLAPGGGVSGESPTPAAENSENPHPSHSLTTEEKPKQQEPENRTITDTDCENVPFIEYSECSRPMCDFDRVRILYRQFDDHIREFCQQINAKTERLQPCNRNCTGRKEPISRSTLAKCEVSEWPEQFSPCDINRCIRNRTRHSNDPIKQRDPECIRIQWVQEIGCLPHECQNRSN